jgi:aminopeptidase N
VVLARLPHDLVLTDPGRHRVFDDRVYKRGALTLHTLRRAVGDDLFFALLRAWVDRHRFGVVTTADFEALVRDETGVDPDRLLGPWLRERALPPLVGAPAATVR